MPLKIGDLARACGRSEHTIRWYEKQKLIPNVGRDGGGRRVYEIAHIEWMAFIDRLRQSGMSIRQIRVYADLVRRGHESLADRQALLNEHRTEIAKRISEMQEAANIIDAKIAYYGLWERDKKRPAEMPSARRKD